MFSKTMKEVERIETTSSDICSVIFFVIQDFFIKRVNMKISKKLCSDIVITISECLYEGQRCQDLDKATLWLRSSVTETALHSTAMDCVVEFRETSSRNTDRTNTVAYKRLLVLAPYIKRLYGQNWLNFMRTQRLAVCHFKLPRIELISPAVYV